MRPRDRNGTRKTGKSSAPMPVLLDGILADDIADRRWRAMEAGADLAVLEGDLGIWGGLPGLERSRRHTVLPLAKDQLARQNLELTVENAELRRQNDLKSTFVSVAAHELCSPLTTIQGYIEMLLDGDAGPLSSEQRDYLGVVRESARRILKTARGLLDVSRIEAGKVGLEPQPFDLLALVQKAVSEFEPELAANAQALALTRAPDLPPVLCDWAATMQIVANLISNAIKYTPHGGHIRIDLDLGPEQGFVQVSVADDGVGVGREDQDKLFGMFFRATSALEVGVSGAGLGLHITRSLVEQQGGRIWFESELGNGSTFYVTLPIADWPDTHH